MYKFQILILIFFLSTCKNKINFNQIENNKELLECLSSNDLISNCLFEQKIVSLDEEGEYYILEENISDTLLSIKVFPKDEDNVNRLVVFFKKKLLLDTNVKNKSPFSKYLQYFENGKIHYEINNISKNIPCKEQNYIYNIDAISKEVAIDTLDINTPYFNGNWIIYFSNGKVKEQFEILDCQYNGLKKEWNKNGSRSKFTNYKSGYLEGKTSYYDSKGKLLYEDYYVKDSLVDIILIDTKYKPPHYDLFYTAPKINKLNLDTIYAIDEDSIDHAIFRVFPKENNTNE